MTTDAQKDLASQIAHSGVASYDFMLDLMEKKSPLVSGYKQAAYDVEHIGLSPERVMSAYVFARAIETQDIASFSEAIVAYLNQLTTWKARYQELKSKLNIKAVSPETRQAWKNEYDAYMAARSNACLPQPEESATAEITLIPGELVVIDDAAYGRSIEIELDQFDGVYRVCIKHDPENRALWYHFDFENKTTLDQFLTTKEVAGLSRAAVERQA